MLSPLGLVKCGSRRRSARNSAAFTHTAGNHRLRIPSDLLGLSCLAAARKRNCDSSPNRHCRQ